MPQPTLPSPSSADIRAESDDSPVGQPTEGAVAARLSLGPILIMAAVGVMIVAFLAYSFARVTIDFGIFSHPPIYGHWLPVLEQTALLMIPAALLLSAVAWLVTSRRQMPTWLAISLLIVVGVGVAAAVAMVRGDLDQLIRGVSTDPDSPYYTSDLHYVEEYGIRGFVEHHPDLVPEFHAYNSKTHPAGIHLVLHVLYKVLGAHPLRVATVIAFIGMAAAANAWAMGRVLGGERAGRIAAVLFVAAPGPLMLAYTSMDAVYATAMTAAAALFMVALHRRSATLAALGGAALAAATLLTYATAFIALATALAAIVQLRRVREIARLLGAAALGGVVTLALARLLLGFDILAAYNSSPPSGHPYDPYWVFGAPAAWLIYAGLPIAALGVYGLGKRFPDARKASLPLVIVLLMVVWAALPAEWTKLRPGEVERTWAFLYPMLAATAGLVVDRWTRHTGRLVAGLVVVTLVVISLVQTTVIQALWDNVF
ncbi:hypothetical protein [Catellatospora citrea]|uniref:Dolichyl-phosphate-mannose-protein mannosyltransferase n=1 Tax=Catellatospora citrea TaxID=53366 RepID=A0A8J3P5D5_9ACTN|nr:hypothetical protein [Catellatospora citrea]RKE09599.1 hypothetical protein C8E86_4489 [Catellatospora citrea]GIG02171.1 hypothetical protein Cci01nite_72640 [Catellatospora citrea]